MSAWHQLEQLDRPIEFPDCIRRPLVAVEVFRARQRGLSLRDDLILQRAHELVRARSLGIDRERLAQAPHRGHDVGAGERLGLIDELLRPFTCLGGVDRRLGTSRLLEQAGGFARGVAEVGPIARIEGTLQEIDRVRETLLVQRLLPIVEVEAGVLLSGVAVRDGFTRLERDLQCRGRRRSGRGNRGRRSDGRRHRRRSCCGCCRHHAHRFDVGCAA